MVFYRKYRSQTIAELDNAKLREALYSLFVKGKDFPHAFLFTGPKGLGKTSTARIIAKVINCEKPIVKDGKIEPCNLCDTCLSITKGINIDVLEIDGASNRGIDEIRDLREKVRLAPSSAKKKVYIIDEVHMLTAEAFNALLKTIEEPPEHVVFIFCTTEPQKIPQTIISRCFHIALSLATEAELMRSFKRIVKGEKLQVDDEALSAIAKLANGGFRDGAKILEELTILQKDEQITKTYVEKVYKISDMQSFVEKFLQGLAHYDTKLGLSVIAGLVDAGVDMRYFTAQVIMSLHSQLLALVQGGSAVHTYAFSGEDISRLVSLLTKAYQDFKYAVVVQLPLEMLVIEWGTRKKNVQSEKTGPIPFSPGKPSLTTLLKKQHALRVQSVLSNEDQKQTVKPVATIRQNAIPDKHEPQKTLLENIIYAIKTQNHSLAAVLRSCTIRSFDDGAIIFEAAYKFHKERLDELKGRQTLEKVVKEITGKNLSITIVLKNAEILKQKAL